MQQECPNCGNRAIYSNKCMTCGYTLGAPLPGGQGNASRPSSQPTDPAPSQPPNNPPTPPSRPTVVTPPQQPQQPQGGALLPTNQQTNPLLPKPQPQNVSQLLPPRQPFVQPINPVPAGTAWHNWDTLLINGKPVKYGPPAREGIVENLDGPHSTQTKPSVLRQILTSWGLGKISPWMAQGGYMIGQKDFYIWNCRLKLSPAHAAANNGGPEAVVIIRNRLPQISFQLGDAITVWGKIDRDSGVLLAENVYVYRTNSWSSYRA